VLKVWKKKEGDSPTLTLGGGGEKLPERGRNSRPGRGGKKCSATGGFIPLEGNPAMGKQKCLILVVKRGRVRSVGTLRL